MRLAQLLALGPELAALILAFSAHRAHAIAQTAITAPNLNLSPLGRVAIAGDFDSISLYSYAGQNEDTFTTNGSQALLSRFPNGAFQTLGLADASIRAMCPLMANDGSLQGVVVGGNFTSLGGVEAQSIALWNPDTANITALTGLSGAVNALYCDSDSGTVYVGGRFGGGDSANSITWKTTKGWTSLPFAGFNGPVTSITKNAAGNIVFAGQFNGLGNATTPETPDSQVVNLGSGNITSSGTTSTDGFSSPNSIICSTGAQDGAGNTWLLQDNTRGWWQGDYGFGFNPTKIRLYNTNYNGRGAKTFYFEELNSGGILNMTYQDAHGTPQSCSERCPLAHNATGQDFRFSPTVGMSSFRIYITEWYGNGGGLSGIEMFQDDIYSFAVTDFNEPKCDDVSQGSNSIATPNGTWTRVREPSTIGGSDYLSANLTNSSQIDSSTNVFFQPNLRQSGNYSISIYTPGCLQDGSCGQRGQVNITGTMTAGGKPFSTTLFQSNDYDKFDQIYYGPVDADSFRPSVTLAPVSGQNAPLVIVAQRVRFELINSTDGLNGLYEYNPSETSVSTDFSNSTIDAAGASLDPGAMINSVISYQDTLYVAGNFSGEGISNFMSILDNATAVPGGGLNGPVYNMFQNASMFYIGGNFSNTVDKTVAGLNSIAVFDASSKAWTALGAGVDQAVTSIVPLQLNVTSSDLEDCIALTGNFTTVNAFSGSADYTADGFAVWVPGRQNWLHNINGSTIELTGDLTAYTNLSASERLYAGQIFSQSVGMSGAVELLGSTQPSLQSLGVQISAQSFSNSSTHSRKRSLATSGKNSTGVYNGLFVNQGNLNITVLGGSFSATASNGSTVQNLVFINNTDSNSQSISGIGGLDAESIFVALATQGTKLFAGGAVKGPGINGLVVYDLATSQYVSPSPPALAGGNVVVNTIAPQPSSSAVYVGGDFSEAGSLPCATLCFYDTNTNQWNTPGSGLTGSISSMFWSATTKLTIAGNLTVNGNATTMATYDSKQLTFSAFAGASTLPGPITAFSSGTATDEFWVAGTATSNQSAYLTRYSNNAWTGVSGLGPGTTIRGLTVVATNDNHAESALVPKNQLLLISGNINLPDFGNASAVLFNGTTYEPFVLTTMEDGSQGSISGIFVQNTSELSSTHTHHLALGLVVLVGLAIALGLIFFMVCAGICLERNRRRREGYMRMPTTGTNPRTNLERINPASLFAGIGEQHKAPKI